VVTRRARSSAISLSEKRLPDPVRIFDAKLIAVVAIELIQRFDQQVIDRYPDRPRQFELPPKTRDRFGWLVYRSITC